jgi:hypothetical protein
MRPGVAIPPKGVTVSGRLYSKFSSGEGRRFSRQYLPVFPIIAERTGDLMLDFSDPGCSSGTESAEKTIVDRGLAEDQLLPASGT